MQRYAVLLLDAHGICALFYLDCDSVPDICAIQALFPALRVWLRRREGHPPRFVPMEKVGVPE